MLYSCLLCLRRVRASNVVLNFVYPSLPIALSFVRQVYKPDTLRQHPVVGRMPMLVGGDMGSYALMQGVAADLCSDRWFGFTPAEFVPFLGWMHGSWCVFKML